MTTPEPKIFYLSNTEQYFKDFESVSSFEIQTWNKDESICRPELVFMETAIKRKQVLNLKELQLFLNRQNDNISQYYYYITTKYARYVHIVHNYNGRVVSDIAYNIKNNVQDIKRILLIEYSTDPSSEIEMKSMDLKRLLHSRGLTLKYSFNPIKKIRK